MKKNQLTHGAERRVMYVENKDGRIDGVTSARIGWVSFSNSGLTVYYRDKVLVRTKGRGIRGNYRDAETSEEYWVSGVKKRGSNAHYEVVDILVDADAVDEYRRIRRGEAA
jgi:hypothetical protein